MDAILDLPSRTYPAATTIRNDLPATGIQEISVDLDAIKRLSGRSWLLSVKIPTAPDLRIRLVESRKCMPKCSQAFV